MKTTLMIPDRLYRSIKQQAASSHRTISAVVAELLQTGMRAAPAKCEPLPPLPSYDMGEMLVDVADRDAIERALRPGS